MIRIVSVLAFVLLVTGCSMYLEVEDPGPGKPKVRGWSEQGEDKILSTSGDDAPGEEDSPGANSEKAKDKLFDRQGKEAQNREPLLLETFEDNNEADEFGFFKSDRAAADPIRSRLLEAGTRQARDWPMFQGGSHNTGHSGDKVIGVPLLLKWRTAVGSRFSSPPVVADGIIYAVCTNGLAVALDFESGELLWQTQLDSSVLGASAVAGGQLFVPGLVGNVYALDLQTGVQLQKYITGLPSPAMGELLGTNKPAVISNVVVRDGQVFYAGHDGKLYQIDPQQRKIVATTVLGGPVRTGSFAVLKGSAVVTSSTGDLRHVRSDGESIWTTKLTRAAVDAFRIPPVITGSAVLMATGQDSLIFSKSLRNGSTNWYAKEDGQVVGLATDGSFAYTTAHNATRCTVTAFDLKSGRIAWRLLFPSSGISSPVIANGFVYVGLTGGDSSLAAIDATSGQLLWRAGQFTSISTAPVPYAGHLVAAIDSGYIAVYEPSDTLTDNPIARTPLPQPYIDWEGTVAQFTWRYSKWPKTGGRFKYRMTDFDCQFQPLDDASPWTVVSKAMIPFEPYLMSPTYTGLEFPKGKERVRVIGVRGIDRRSRDETEFVRKEVGRYVTALIVARKIRGQWQPIYVNNWLTSWRTGIPGAADEAIAGYYLNKGRPFDVYVPLDNPAIRNVLAPFDRMLVIQAPDQSIARGQLRMTVEKEVTYHGDDSAKGEQSPAPAEGPIWTYGERLERTELKVTHYWGSRFNHYEPMLIYGDKNKLNMLEIYR